MKILGLIGSDRAMGNTELLVTEVAKAAVATNTAHEVRMLRLTDLRLAYCTGCMGCALGEDASCPLDDDFEFLVSEYSGCDALILGAPAYTLLPPAPLKLIADRLILYLARRVGKLPKPAVTVGVAGLPRWSEMLVPWLNCIVLSQGFYLVDSLLAYGAGPGEVLLDSHNLERARSAGRALGLTLVGERVELAKEPGRCPVCGADFFRITQRGIECPLCLAKGQLKDGVPLFEASPPNRWEPAALERHFTEWIQGTGESYLEKRPAIRPLMRDYRQRPFAFVRPPRSATDRT